MTGSVIAGLVVAVIAVLVVRGRRTREVIPPGYVSPTMAETSAVIRTGLTDVRSAAERCERTTGDEFVVAWRELYAVLESSLDNLEVLLGSPRRRLRRMGEVASQELWDMADRWLGAHVPATPADMALLHRTLLPRTEAALAAYRAPGPGGARAGTAVAPRGAGRGRRAGGRVGVAAREPRVAAHRRRGHGASRGRARPAVAAVGVRAHEP